jgi:peptide chain release factor subunit 1
MAAIDSIGNRLKAYKKPPDNGIVFFVGHVAVGGDQTQMVYHLIEPPDPIATFLYRCDSSFYLDPLLAMLTETDVYGLVVIDRGEATIGILKGKRVSIIKNIQSLVPSKHGRGGQSQRRFERLIEIAAHEFFKKVGDLVNDSFLEEKELKGILVGGPGATKDFFVSEDYLHHELKKKLIDTFDTGYTNEHGLKELMGKATETLSEIDLMKEKKVVQRFLDEVRKPDGGLSVYGEDEVIKALNMGAVDTLLISESLRKFRLKIKCDNCDHTEEITSASNSPSLAECPECNSSLSVKENADIIKELYRMAEEVGTKIELISGDSEEGEMLVRAFGGIVGILR